MKGYMLNEVDTGTKDDAGNAVMTTELWCPMPFRRRTPRPSC